MKTSITNAQGVVIERSGDGLYVEGKELEEAAFDDRWIDLFAEMHEGSGAAALTREGYRDTGFEISFFRHNQDDKIFMVYQMAHGWNKQAVRPHMHCVPMANGTGSAIFEFNYAWAPAFSTIPLASGWTTGSVTASFAPSDQYVHTPVAFGSVEPISGSGASTMLFFAVVRLGASNAGDTYSTGKDHGTAAANVGIVYFDAHVQLSSAGTVTEFV